MESNLNGAHFIIWLIGPRANWPLAAKNEFGSGILLKFYKGSLFTKTMKVCPKVKNLIFSIENLRNE